MKPAFSVRIDVKNLPKEAFIWNHESKSKTTGRQYLGLWKLALPKEEKKSKHSAYWLGTLILVSKSPLDFFCRGWCCYPPSECWLGAFHLMFTLQKSIMRFLQILPMTKSGPFPGDTPCQVLVEPPFEKYALVKIGSFLQVGLKIQ